MALTLRQLKYFVATAELGQISQAAIQLTISQSAVTSAIKELEDSLGTQLFLRTSAGVTLTDTGRRFLNHAYAILSSVDEAMRIPNLESTLTGTLAIAASYTVLGYFLPHHVLRLNTLYPRLTIHLHELNRESIEEGLIAGRYDMAVLLTSNVSNPELVLEPVIHSVRRLWVGAHHPLLRRESVTFAEVAREPFVMLTVDEAGQTAMRYWNETPYRPNVILRTSSVEAVRSMVANGTGVAVLSDMVYRPWSLEGRRIETIVLRDPVPPMSVGLAWRKNIELSPAMHAVRDYFRHTFMEPRAVGGGA
ncbi:LysR family transcriptional regulator [Burkholderia pseudomultivorans]|uniref:HTH-type transcriptional regulator CynR n=2 Tax=Burkholderia cepacia complex TaxID=87882 RepID=A0A132E6X0_9BURK|nr:LysR family transcriptional regulator [Burkholderia pseudomultivorans]AIO31445.1 bacterial regulatory helix-turn-helix, lysR family protein [Burkholderia cenocepacia]KWF00306.1 LysR family transcriptional regulator [Burkholderia pseudomultivorans]KWF17676.1 LysR family transcriptional regulator [Burkholderia pseudomultivorans]KWF64789.1 LysR family transcriptional regulator [Burkholderia pseudomultivorans]MBF5009548.1 LysR family transcriptional regulator [Burkholderia pseudomultivorans]